MKILILLNTLNLATSLRLGYIYSALTWNSEVLLKPSQNFNKYLLTSTNEIPQTIPFESLDLIIDYTKAPLLSYSLSKNCYINNLNYLQGYYSNTLIPKLAYNPLSETNSLLSLLFSLKINNWAVIYSPDFLLDYEKLINLSFFKLPISFPLSSEQLLRHLQELKYHQITTILLLLNGANSAFVLSTCSINQILGYSWILSAQADYLPFSNKTLLEQQGVVRLSLTTHEYWPDYTANIFLNCSETEYFSCLNSFGLENYQLKGNFYVLNVINGFYTVIGSCLPDCQL